LHCRIRQNPRCPYTVRRSHPDGKTRYERLEKNIGNQKAIVAVARKLLIAVWHVLTKQEADRFIDEDFAARSFFRFAYKTSIRPFADGTTAPTFTRQQLDRIGIGEDVTELPWGSRTFKLPPSTLGESTVEATTG